MRRLSFCCERGSALLAVLAILFALSLIGLASFRATDDEMAMTANMTGRTRAFLAAEAGLARTDYILRANPNMTDADSLLQRINADAALPNSHFQVTMDTVLPVRQVISTGNSEQGSAAIRVLYRYGFYPVNIWNNAIFAGHGQDGVSIRGNVGVHGSVHILGDGEPFQDSNGNGQWDKGEPFQDANHDGSYDAPLEPGDAALDMTGTATISNNYSGMPAELASRLPALPTVTFGGETVSTLNAEVRIQHGHVVLDGNAKVGQPDVTGGTPAVKETMDGVYVTDGFQGSAASSAVYADNGFANPYDLEGSPVTMPNLDDPYTDKSGTYYPTYMQYLKSNALVIKGDLEIRRGGVKGNLSNGRGSISLDNKGNLTISGIVYVQGKITITGDNTGQPLLYDGKGTLVAEDDVLIDNNILSKGTFPTDDALGVISYKQMYIGSDDSQMKLMGAFYAQEEVINAKQTQLAGTIVSNWFGMKQVPDIYQVPELVRNLPPGMPGSDDVNIYSWRQVPRSWMELD